jgi:hypothetical protein
MSRHCLNAPELVDVNTNQQDKGQQIALQVDRSLRTRLGVSQELIDATLNNAFGQRQVSVIYNPLNQYYDHGSCARIFAKSGSIEEHLCQRPARHRVPVGTGKRIVCFCELRFDQHPFVCQSSSRFLPEPSLST